MLTFLSLLFIRCEHFTYLNRIFNYDFCRTSK